MTSITSRRQLLAWATIVGPPFGVLIQKGMRLITGIAPVSVATAQEAGTPIPSRSPGAMVGRAEAPHWTFTVLSFQDPYTGKLTKPTEPDADVRYVSAEVVIDNGSDQPLEFPTSAVHLRDEQGVEYSASSSVVGAEPKLTGQNLPGGERTRGTVWFAVPKGVRLIEMKFVAPPPQFRVSLPTLPAG